MYMLNIYLLNLLNIIYVCIYIFIAVVFPQDLLENGVLAANNFAMLGLGDIVIPGIFIAFLLRFDQRYVFKFLNFKF